MSKIFIGTQEIKVEAEVTPKTMLDVLYPIGAIYTTTDSTFNPNEKFPNTYWVNLSGGEDPQKSYVLNSTAGEIPVFGNGKVLSVTNGSAVKGLWNIGSFNGLCPGVTPGKSVSTDPGDWTNILGKFGVVQKSQLTKDTYANSGLIADLSASGTAVYMWKRIEKPWWLDTASLTADDIGKIEKVLIDGVEYSVRLIDIDKDDLADGSGKAHTTWQFINPISTSNWNVSNAKTKYSVSTINTELSTGGSIYNLLPVSLRNRLKTITKNVGDQNSGSTSGITALESPSLSSKLFLLSGSEIGLGSDTTYTGRGYNDTTLLEDSVYSYWSTHTSVSERIMKDTSGTAVKWALRSPYGSAGSVILSYWYNFVISNTGILTNDVVTNTNGICPAFCI